MSVIAPKHRKRISDEVADSIKELLFSSSMNVGDKLPTEKKLAERFGVSQVPVREALFSLQKSGLLKIKRGAGGGIFVSEPNPDSFSEILSILLRFGKATVEDLTEARLYIEPAIAWLAAQRADSEAQAKIKKSIDYYENNIKTGGDRCITDMEFHISLAEASGNVVLLLIAKSLMELLYRTVKDFRLSIDHRYKCNDTHRRIYEAVLISDPDLARRLMKEHVEEMAHFWERVGPFPHSEILA
ncbi:MAG: FadR family transcriptional regulator [Deltaproteobacteria bacterium]|nr:FadR family transcriptional regulator [Deltaproteobacteria bacterium]